MNNCPFPKYGALWTLRWAEARSCDPRGPGIRHDRKTQAYSARPARSDPGPLAPDGRASGAAVGIALGAGAEEQRARPAEDPWKVPGWERHSAGSISCHRMPPEGKVDICKGHTGLHSAWLGAKVRLWSSTELGEPWLHPQDSTTSSVKQE